MSRAHWTLTGVGAGWLAYIAHLVTVAVLADTHPLHMVGLAALTTAVTLAAMAVLIEPIRRQQVERDRVDPETQAAIHHIGERLGRSTWRS